MAEHGLDLDTSLAFDKDKQAAIFAWCLFDKGFCESCSKVVSGDWFASPYIRLLYNAYMELYESEGRQVTALELLKHHGLGRKEKADQEVLKKTLEHALLQCNVYKLGLLKKEMTSWMKAVSFFQAMTKASQQYNAHNVDAAWQIIDDAALFKASSSFEEGANEGFAPASIRVMEESKERMEQAPKVLQYGVTYLQDTLGGILPVDLSLIGGPPGRGKTQLVTCITKAITASGHPGYYFALEGENNEIERRLKYAILADAYFQLRTRDPERYADDPEINYTEWRHGRIEHIFGELEKQEEVRESIQASVKNLFTLYRNSGNFDAKVLGKQLLKIVDKAHWIVIDHFHYIDIDGETNENREQKKIMKTIRDIVLKHGVPVGLVAHVRKQSGGRSNKTLLETLDGFMGSSDVPKISTTAIMISPAVDQGRPEEHLLPTYMSVEKSRLEGSRTWYTGLTYFNSKLSVYEPMYRLGRMDFHRTEWTEITDTKKIPRWAKNADRSGIPFIPIDQ